VWALLEARTKIDEFCPVPHGGTGQIHGPARSWHPGTGIQKEFAGMMFGPGPILRHASAGRANIYLLRRKVGS